MTQSHTSGPWIADNGDSNVWGVFTDNGEEALAYMEETKEKAANATLMAAAPDMLAALRMVQMLRQVGGMLPGVKTLIDEVVKEADAAIDKATGVVK